MRVIRHGFESRRRYQLFQGFSMKRNATCKKLAKRGPAQVAAHGSVSIPIYRRQTRTGVVYSVHWYEGSTRRRKAFADRSEASSFADAKAREISRHGATGLTITGADLLIYQRARRIAEELGVAVDVALEEYAAARKALGPVPLPVAIREYTLSKPPIDSKQVSDVVREMVEAKKQAKRSLRHVEDLTSRLKRFAKSFACPLASVTIQQVETWLQSLAVGPRSRQNYVVAATSLVRFAERRGYVARGALDLSVIERSKSASDIQVFTPDELARLLSATRSDLVPFVAIGAFAGLRAAEICRLDWAEVGEEFIEVKAAKSKTRARRLVTILPALAKWLSPHRGEGRVCPLEEPWHALAEGARRAGVAWKPNGLRHSFGSYRLAIVRHEGQVAQEMGNTPAMIHGHYRALVTPAQAEAWFGVMPI